MQQKKEEKNLPRFYKEFIGIGHQLEQRRKERRRVQLQERAVANRVLFLEKEELRAQKSLLKKREQLGKMMQVAQRQAHEKDLKDRVLLERERQLQIAKEQNHLRRILHKQNREHSLREIVGRNSLDYKIGKTRLKQGEARKKQEQRMEMASRQERYQSLNVSRDQGRSRIDKFFKDKNLEHTRLYKQKIKQEEGTVKQKADTIKKLAEIQEVLRKRLEESSMRVSQMDQILGDFSQTIKEKSNSRLSLHHTFDSPRHEQAPSLITSVQGELLGHHDQLSQNMLQGEGGVSEGGRMRRRRRNKHANRYKQYQQF